MSLASPRTDEQLERSVNRVFERFGTVYVKIRRDTRGMPYAFCQYEVTVHRNMLLRAYTDVSRMFPIRTLPLSKDEAHRSMGVSVVQSVQKLVVRTCVLSIDAMADTLATGALYLSRITGGPISEEEANEVLDGFGPLEKIWIATPTDKEMYRLPEGVFVMWEFFQGARDAHNVRHSSFHRPPFSD